MFLIFFFLEREQNKYVNCRSWSGRTVTRPRAQFFPITLDKWNWGIPVESWSELKKKRHIISVDVTKHLFNSAVNSQWLAPQLGWLDQWMERYIRSLQRSGFHSLGQAYIFQAFFQPLMLFILLQWSYWFHFRIFQFMSYITNSQWLALQLAW